MVADGQRLVESLLNLICRVEVVFPSEYDDRSIRLRRANSIVGTWNAEASPMM